MIRASAPIANDQDRRAIAHIVARIRPEWDRKGIESALAKHPDQMLDILAAQAINAAATRADQRTPACLGLDGDHTNRARVSLGAPVSVTAKMPGYAAIEPECGYPDCGVRRDKHLAHIIPAEIPGHEWEQPREVTRSSSEFIARAKSAALTAKEEHVSTSTEAGERLPSVEQPEMAQRVTHPNVRTTASAFRPSEEQA